MKGTTLIEVLVALAAAVVVITTVTVLGVSSLNNVQFTNDQHKATQYAQEGIEFVRGLRNSNYDAFKTYSGLYCFGSFQATLGTPTASCTTKNIDNKFIRSVLITQNGGCGLNLVHTAVTVVWTDSKCTSGNYCHESKLTSCFSTVNPISAP